MVTFYGYPKEHWKHLRTTNIVESPFASVRLRTSAAKRFKKVASATALIWRVLLVAEKSFRRLDHAALLAEVAEGAKYIDGVRVVEETNDRDREAVA
ncbi:MAG: Transposase, Mutator family [Acidobacteria bacterium ADurb.Bin051]|jgi:transposase-like protein|nr:MAG: Transposase, Mutator family [Acidobacteria bacterium ADurb.Bin051]